MPQNTDEVIKIYDDSDEHEPSPSTPIPKWKILMVDDEMLVHKATEFALEKHTILGRKLELTHAYSAEEARDLFRSGERFAVALIDVVMESNEAGLELIEWIRSEGYESERLIIRTGQPGYAPELSVLKKYDINDYRTKNELTSSKLISVLITAIRSYYQLIMIKKSRKGLKNIVDASSNLFLQDNLEKLSYGALTQLTDMLEIDANGFVCSYNEKCYEDNSCRVKMLSGIGKYQNLIGDELEEFPEKEVFEVYKNALGKNMYTDNSGTIALIVPGVQDKEIFIYIESGVQLNDAMLDLIVIFANNIDLAFRNLELLNALNNKAYIDESTGIPNQNSMMKMLDSVISESEKEYVLVEMHSPNWETIYGYFGIEMSNKLQGGIYNLITSTETGVIHAAKLNNGNLALLFEKQNFSAEELSKYLVFSFTHQKTKIQLTVEIGVTEISAYEKDAYEIIKHSNLATFWARSNTEKPIAFYDEFIMGQIENRIFLLSKLQKALQQEEDPIEIYFQPKVNALDEKIVGAEALARWNTISSPDIFIPLIEESGLSSLLNDLLLEKVGGFAKYRRDNYLKALPVSINLSMKDMVKTGFAEELIDKLRLHQLGTDEIEFEITESRMMKNISKTISELSVLHRAGYRISIDDFGTGYSSLNYLAQLPADVIKIDKSFIKSLSPINARKSIVSTIIAIAENRGMEVIAEGVENSNQVMALLFFGCEICQGFYYHKPMTIDSFIEKTGSSLTRKEIPATKE